MFVREQQAGVNYATYLVGARGPEYRRQDSGANTGQVRWYVYDGLGSVLAEVDPSGNITSKRKYDVYGLVRNAGVAGDNAGGTSSHKFVGSLGHASENNTGYVYMRARYYDPAIGRFSSEDPASHGRNWFAYCNNDPVNCTDESGKYEDDIFQAMSFIWSIVQSCSPAALFMLADFFERQSKYDSERAANAFIAACQMETRALAANDGIDPLGVGKVALEEMSATFFKRALECEGKSIVKLALARQLRILAYTMAGNGELGGFN